MSTGYMRDLENAIATKSASVFVVGLGYVGLPLACRCASVGFQVHGFDLDINRAEAVMAGRNPLGHEEPGLDDAVAASHRAGRLTAGADAKALVAADIVFVCVETPVGADNRPNYAPLLSACRTIGENMRSGSMVVVESTLAPGTMRDLVVPTIEGSSGLVAGQDFAVGHCPERVMPGRLLRNMASMPRVCGGLTPPIAELMRAFYVAIVTADVDATDMETAELVKTVENAYRDVNIAFANEVAMICERVGGDVDRVRELVNKPSSEASPRQMLIAGAGVGGSCIPKDPWLLAHAASTRGVTMTLIPAARRVNDGMPAHVIELLNGALAQHGRSVAGAQIVVLGASYLPNAGDLRGSPTTQLLKELEYGGAFSRVHDPHARGYFDTELSPLLEGADAVVLMVSHDEYKAIDLNQLRALLRTPVLIDGRRLFDAAIASAAGLTYRSIGRYAGEKQ